MPATDLGCQSKQAPTAAETEQVDIAICQADEIVQEDLGGNIMGQTESSLENQRQAFPLRLT
jgi:hypothetical protein